MRIELYEPQLRRNPKPFAFLRHKGFFGFVYSALMECKGAAGISKPRPLSRMPARGWSVAGGNGEAVHVQSRTAAPLWHESAWASFDNHPVFFDMGDFTHIYDLDALKLCDVYFKTNLNWQVTRRVLEHREMLEHQAKIVPFFSFGDVDQFQRYERIYSSGLGRVRRRYDLCHIVGVTSNRRRQGETSVFSPGGPPADSGRYHFWIRYHCQAAMKEAGISGYYRLVARNKEYVDREMVFPRLLPWAYADRILRARMAMVNTLPHAILPWKATESLALGRPLVIEQAPLVEMPEPFALKKDAHYLELFPDLGGFDSGAELADPRSWRVYTKISLRTFSERAEWLRTVLEDRVRIEYMTRNVSQYSREVLKKGVVADYICEQAHRIIH